MYERKYDWHADVEKKNAKQNYCFTSGVIVS